MGKSVVRAVFMIALPLTGVVACSTSSGGNNQQFGGAQTNFALAVTPGSGVSGFDQGFCSAERQRGLRCASQGFEQSSRGGWSGRSSFTQNDHNRCLEKSCALRTTHGADVAQAIDNCLLQRNCADHSEDNCTTMILGMRAQSPQAQQAFSKCSPFQAKCAAAGALGEGSHSLDCSFVAQLGPELLNAVMPCFDLACGLGQQCFAGHLKRAEIACDLPDQRNN